MADYGFTRVSTGSQDHTTQGEAIHAAYPDAVIVSAGVASASKGQQLDEMDKLISRLQPGDRVIVTDSSRLDRREDLDAQAEVLLRIRREGADVVSMAEPQFGKTDFAGRIVTLVAQEGNAQKSRTVKKQTWRGVQAIIASRSHYGPLPMFWVAEGERYHKQARCTNAASVLDIYEAVADGESLQNVARRYDVWPQQIKNLVKYEANHTGVIRYSYTHDGETAEWTHSVTPIVPSPLWWRANKVLLANATTARANRGGRPVATAANWVSGVFDCPACGGRLFVNAGHTPSGRPRTPKLRCGGQPKTRKACGQFLGMDVAPVVAALDELFASDDTELLAFQRVSGNAHELEEMKATRARLSAALSATDDDDQLDTLVGQRKALSAQISAFELVPDKFDYAPVTDGPKTVAELWASSDQAKRSIVRAVKQALGLEIVDAEVGGPVRWFPAPEMLSGDNAGIVDLGGGICFRRVVAR